MLLVIDATKVNTLCSIFVVLFLVASPSQAQIDGAVSIEEYPLLTNFYNEIHKVNPAWNTSIDTSLLYTGMKVRTGILSRFRDNSFIFQHRFPSRSRKHMIGVNFHTEKQGELLSISRVYLRYGLVIPLAESLILGAAVDLGMYSYNFRASVVNAGESFTLPDATIGIALHYKSAHQLGVSSAQFLDLIHVGEKQEVQLQRLFYASYSGKVIIANGAELEFLLLSQFSGARNRLHGQIRSEINGFQLFWGMDNDLITHLGIGLNVFRIKKYQGKLSLNYNLPLNPSFINVNEIEINLVLKR